MIKYIYILIFCNFFWLSSRAQETVKYTYVEDRQFIKESDIFGCTFVPYEGKMSTAHYPDPLQAGIVSFEISSMDVLITERANYTPAGIINPPTDDKPYRLRVAGVQKMGYAYDIKLVDPRNRDLKGYLKLYFNGISQITTIKYRPSLADAEHTYIVSPTPKEELEHDSKFFTHQQDFDARTLDELWGKTLYPFLSLENQSNIDYRKVHRLYEEDNIMVQFEEKTIMKGKKEKILQYVSFTTKEDGRKEFLLKKVKEIQYQNRDGNRKVLELYVKDEAKGEDHTIILHRGVKSMLKAVELIDGATNQSRLYYEMRIGKSVIE